MRTMITACIVGVATGACGPEAGDGEHAPPGVLEYEHPEARMYRLDRRVDVVPFDLDRRPRECGFLTDRAYDELVTTIEALDPTVDYDVWEGCRETFDPRGRVYIEGFEHSPFACDWDCCHPDLAPVSLVYFVVENNFVGIEPVVDDVPYVAIQPDRPCE